MAKDINGVNGIGGVPEPNKSNGINGEGFIEGQSPKEINDLAGMPGHTEGMSQASSKGGFNISPTMLATVQGDLRAYKFAHDEVKRQLGVSDEQADTVLAQMADQIKYS